tara:strand:- start:389 stop:664 length:276 start_codon:yes stop_codon:yes gene_type:complete
LEEAKDHVEEKEELRKLVYKNFQARVRYLIRGVVCIAVNTVSAYDSDNYVEILLPFFINFYHKLVQEPTSMIVMMIIYFKNTFDLTLSFLG